MFVLPKTNMATLQESEGCHYPNHCYTGVKLTVAYHQKYILIEALSPKTSSKAF